MGAKLRIEKDTMIIEEGEDSLVSKLVQGCEGKLTVRGRKIKTVKDKNGKVIGKNKEKKEDK
jgi:ABC-type histidine transport system ATPase subunit